MALWCRRGPLRSAFSACRAQVRPGNCRRGRQRRPSMNLYDDLTQPSSAGPVYVVLAAGAARRMGFDKVVAPFRGRSPLERVVAALGGRDRVVVVPSRRIAEASAA